MPQYNRAELGRMAMDSGFVRDTYEKVLRLKEILRFLNENEFLRNHLLLKGGTAINLMVLTDKEQDYLDSFEQKKYMPELLFDDKEIVERVRNHPMALWKCKN